MSTGFIVTTVYAALSLAAAAAAVFGGVTRAQFGGGPAATTKASDPGPEPLSVTEPALWDPPPIPVNRGGNLWTP